MKIKTIKSGLIKALCVHAINLIFALFFGTILSAILINAPVASAEFINMGTLDVAPVAEGDKPANDWLIEYLKPGESLQERIRVSNFGTKEKNLTIYAADTDKNDGKDFLAKSPCQESDDIAGWIRLPSDNLTLGPGESKILSVNFVAPENAGVGLHTGAIIVRETATAGNDEIALEKGVRIYLNVTGPVINSFEVAGASLQQSGSKIKLRIKTKNTGTTDYVAGYKLETENVFGGAAASNVFGGTAASNEAAKRIKPGTTGVVELVLPEPGFGLYNIYASSPAGASHLGTTLYMPFWIVLLTLCAPLFACRKNLRYVQLRDFPAILRTPQYRKTAVYFGMLALAIGSTYFLANLDPGPAQAQIARPRPADSYIFTAKWGNFRRFPPHPRYVKDWNGEISFANANITIMDYLHFEQNDKAEIINNNSALRFKNTTGPDNDGVILKVEPVANRIPEVTYSNFNTGEQYTYAITDFLNAPGIYPDTLFAALFRTAPGPEHILPATAEELEATPEIEATPPAGAIIPELENLFVEELPATPEALADFVLKSNYVKEIVTERKTARVKTDMILIEALAATPEVLAEITATPDLNFIFVPGEMIKFPPQEFSFSEEKITTKNLGPMIFVQKKGTPWNTYVGTTDFTSLSTPEKIPASSLTVIPGEPIVIGKTNGAGLQPGNPRTFKGTADKSVLLNVEPGRGARQIIILNPLLQIRIPPGTLPGHYRGTLTITSL